MVDGSSGCRSWASGVEQRESARIHFFIAQKLSPKVDSQWWRVRFDSLLLLLLSPPKIEFRNSPRVKQKKVDFLPFFLFCFASSADFRRKVLRSLLFSLSARRGCAQATKAATADVWETVVFKNSDGEAPKLTDFEAGDFFKVKFQTSGGVNQQGGGLKRSPGPNWRGRRRFWVQLFTFSRIFAKLSEFLSRSGGTGVDTTRREIA